MTIALGRLYHPQYGRLLGVQDGEIIYDISEHFESVSDWLQSSIDRVDDAIGELETLIRQAETFDAAEFDNAPASDVPHWLAPVDEQEVWAAGVTYERSRDARQLEAIDGGDVYARVYSATRPELFMKATGWRVIGHLGEVGIRQDATWSVPEPELALVLNPALEVVGFTVGNDMSSRDIEGENPLYLPQAKMYTASCALGPAIVLQPAGLWPETTIQLKIERAENTVFAGTVETSRIHRRLSELVEYLGRAYTFPDGAVLLTGTGLVPPDDFTLEPGDVVKISIDGVGTLTNTVKLV
ncbi:MAG: fumarylacetoacetate hydrolase family protein [Chloroflexi bacterium]|nr:fumarylacetoacetate hydrolase family protein [Chloroflexota bacterium]